MKRKLIVVDVETGGLDPRVDSILSFGAIIYQDGSIVNEFYTLIQEPTVHASDEALGVNGFSLDTLSNAPNPWAAVMKFQQWLYYNQLYGEQTLVAHKVDFDASFLRRLWDRAGKDFNKQFGHRHMCTQSLALLLDQAGRINLPGGSASLDNVAAAYGLARSGEKHNALEDARLCAKILAKMIEQVRH